MKSVTVASLAILVTVGAVAAQGFGAQPGFFGPFAQYPQVVGTSQLSNSPSAIPPLQFPGCSDIKSIGSPILLIAQAEKYIEDAMRVQNQGSLVTPLYRQDTTDPLKPLVTFTTLIYQIRTQSGLTYVGVKFSAVDGFGGVQFEKGLLNPNLNIVKKVFGIAAATSFNPSFSCGDQKATYTSYGNDPRSKLPGQHPGLNRNGAFPAMIKALKEIQTTANAPTYARDCSASRYFGEPVIWYYSDSSIPITPVDDSVYRCNPLGTAVIKAITLNCYGPSVGEVDGITFTFIDPFNQTTTTDLLGSTDSTIDSSIDLTNATRVEIYHSNDPSGTYQGLWMTILGYDANNNIIGKANCGPNGNLSPPPAAYLRNSILMKDFLGAVSQVGGWGYNRKIQWIVYK